MRKSLLFSLSILMGGSVCLTPANAAGGTPKLKPGALKTLLAKKQCPDAGTVARTLSNQLRKSKGQQVLKTADADPSSSFSSPGWGFLLGPDGKQWSYTQTWERNSSGFYTSSTITVYDSSHQQAGAFTVDVSDVSNVNSISVSGDVTSKMFDKDASTYELMVWYHTANNGVTSYKTQVYRLDGTKLYEYDGSSILVDASENEWTTYQRVFLVNDITEDVEQDGETVTKSYVQVDVLKPASWNSDDPEIERTFKLDTENLTMMNGSYINFSIIDGQPYYVLSQYEKPYVADYSYDPTTGVFEPVITENNTFEVTVYDKNFSQVGQIKAPIVKPSDAYYRMAGFGMMSDKDLSKNFFTTDGDFAYVVTWDDYITATDQDRYKFEVYDAEGNSVNTVCDNVYNTYYSLAPVRGQEEQMAFMRIVDDVEQIQTVDLPSCTVAATIPATIDGETISTDLNRYPKGDSYQYVIKMGYATSDDDGNVIARLGWYNKDLSFDRFTSFNLGPNGENFRPGLLDNMLNPYNFNTDDALEYLYIGKIKRTNSNVLDDVLFIADEEGNVLRQFGYDETKGSLYTAMLLTDNMDKPELGVCYMTDDYNYTFDFYDLPFTKFEKGGDGTAENPYLISTTGDLLQVNSAPEAYYKLAADLDLSNYNGSWTPLSAFSGQLDGDNHYIADLQVNTDENRAGLFSSLNANSVVKNLVMINPSVQLTEDNSYVGVVAGDAITATLDNVHVYGADINDPDGQAWATVGGLVGQSSLNGLFSSCSFSGNINVPGSSSVGGIVGDTRTATLIKSSSASGAFTASNTLGGIVGNTGDASTVTDSRASVELTAENTVGGIVGRSSRALVDKCYAEGTIQATTKPMWGGLNAGGIIGDLATDWSQATPSTGEGEGEDTGGSTTVTPAVSNCVAMADITVPALEDGEEADQTVNRIVGRSIINEEWYEGETPVTEQALRSNYALSTMTVGGSTVTSDDATTTNGASIVAEYLDQSFLSNALGYAYGDGPEAPWKGEQGMPVLYYEDNAAALTLSQTAVELNVEQTAELKVSVYGTGADAISFQLSDPEVAEVDVTEEGEGYVVLTLTAKAAGSAVLTASAGTLTAQCAVSVKSTTGVSAPQAEASRLTIRAAAGTVSAAGASRIALYSVNGQSVASAASSSLSTAGLKSGVYVVVATDAAGRTSTAKVVVR